MADFGSQMLVIDLLVLSVVGVVPAVTWGGLGPVFVK